MKAEVLNREFGISDIQTSVMPAWPYELSCSLSFIKADAFMKIHEL